MIKTTISLLLVGVIGGGVGGAVGWFAGRRSSSPTYAYEIRQRAILTNPTGLPIGELEPGVVVVTGEPLNPESDLGWWAYVPVTFGTGTEAAQIIRASPKNISSPVSVTVRALLPSDVAPTIGDKPQQ